MEIMVDGESIQILLVDFEHGFVDWKRINKGYSGVCVSEIGKIDFTTMETNIQIALKAELKGKINPLSNLKDIGSEKSE
jgi:hypothetical protein